MRRRSLREERRWESGNDTFRDRGMEAIRREPTMPFLSRMCRPVMAWILMSGISSVRCKCTAPLQIREVVLYDPSQLVVLTTNLKNQVGLLVSSVRAVSVYIWQILSWQILFATSTTSCRDSPVAA